MAALPQTRSLRLRAGAVSIVTQAGTTPWDDHTAVMLEDGFTATIDMNSTWSDSDNLTGHLKNQDFFDVPKFPTSKFVTTKVAPGGDAKLAGSNTMITGNLTLHGVTKQIAFPAKVEVTEAGAVKLESEFAINRKDFGIVYGGKADDLIRDEVVIKLAVKAQ